jgi:pyruvate dehydrogenase E2 component (dihydrolipoamide acetyltransferase)
MFLANPRTGGVFRNPVEFTEIAPTGMRSTIAKRLTQSKQDIPHWYLKITANMANFVAFRTELNKMAKVVDGKPEYKISANDIIVLAIAKALKRNPSINSSWIDGKIRQYNNVDVSVAVSIDGGLITPIVKNADQKGLLEISKEIKQLAAKARDGKLTPDEYTGGSMSVSNLGMFGVSEFQSIINPPQSCIAAVGAIEEAVVAVNGEAKVCPVCNITFSADHRVIDGSVLAPFASDVKKFLENPALMFVL